MSYKPDEPSPPHAHEHTHSNDGDDGDDDNDDEDDKLNLETKSICCSKKTEVYFSSRVKTTWKMAFSSLPFFSPLFFLCKIYS